MSQKSTLSEVASVLAQYPLLRQRCEGRNGNGAGSMEDHIADAVNEALACGDGPAVATMVRHLATAFLYARTLRKAG